MGTPSGFIPDAPDGFEADPKTAVPPVSLIEGMGPRRPVSDSDVPQEPDALTEMMARAAHPMTLGDVLRMLLPGEVGALIAAKKVGANAPSIRDIIMGTLKGGKNYLAKKAPVVSDIVKGVEESRSAIPMAKGVDRYMPNTSMASRTEFGPAAEHIASSVERYMPNTSAVSREAAQGARQIEPVIDRYMPNISKGVYSAKKHGALVKGPAQATFRQAADGTWAIQGKNLVEGEPVHVMMRSGSGQMARVGKILETLEDGTQIAKLASNVTK